MLLIGLDLGSTYSKIALLRDGRLIREKELPTPKPLSAAPRYEIDAEAYFAQVLSLLEEFYDPQADGVLFSTQMHGYVLTDRRFQPLSPYVSWQDGMGAAALDAIRSLLPPDATQAGGVPLKGNLALVSLLARRLAGETLPKGALLHTLGGYVIARLCGNHVCHATNAAPTGMVDLYRRDWNRPLIAQAGLESLVFPPIVWNLQSVGQWRGISLYPDVGDQQVCAWGANLKKEHGLHVNIGTAGLLGVVCKGVAQGNFECRPWLEDGYFLRTVSGLPGGRMVAAHHAALPGDPAENWRMMTNAPDAPTQALYDTMARAYQDAAKRMGAPVRQLGYSGGCVLKNPALRQTIEKAFAVCEPPELSDIWQGMASLARLIEK